jgi:hypothetical protein
VVLVAGTNTEHLGEQLHGQRLPAERVDFWRAAALTFLLNPTATPSPTGHGVPMNGTAGQHR